ncbi:3-oxoacyl-[acyl-carrier-protein] synthase III C-terminal domain-containing protein [Nonomuraea sp. B12E4]|uniref:3-oxoacyl-[acyl-carrier-protein] synthase III C-terminal domain-containing protein n=1 Tax=Nonomuraea sp. B12E4 TaxID=3153564 RepID=UPI00325F4EC6
MTALEAVSSYLPPGVPVGDLRQELGLSDGELWRFRRFYGLAEVCRAGDMSEAELLVAAAGKLEALRGREHLVRYVLQARTVLTSAPYPINPLAEVRDELGLGHALPYTLTQHTCASGLLAVDLAGRMLATDGDPEALALVLTGERAFTPAAQLIPDVTIMGEGVAAILVRAGGGRDRLLGYATRTDGSFATGMLLTPELAAGFHRVYQRALTEVMAAAVRTAGISLGDLALVLPHNVNKVSWTRAARGAGLPPERIFLDNVAVTGHCFSADPFINYQTARERGLLQPGDRYLMVSVGLGATFSAMVFEH